MFLIPFCTLVFLAFSYTQQTETSEKAMLISKAMPHLELEEFNTAENVTSIMSKENIPNQIFLMNFFASWCPICENERKHLISLSEIYKLPIVGVAYKDKTEDVAKTLQKLGNPYQRIAMDNSGFTGAVWDMTGTPHSYIIDTHGHVRYIHRGDISQSDITNIILPMVNKIKQEDNNKVKQQ